MQFCTQCGSQLPDGYAFCSNCGAPLTVNKSQPDNISEAQSDYQEPQQTQNTQPEYQQSYYQQTESQQPNYQQSYYQQPNYQQVNYQQTGGYKAPIQERNLVTCILLSIVTCGIYGLYWYFCIINDLNTASQKPDDATPGMVLLLSIVTCGIYGWIWLYKAGEKVDDIKKFNGEPASNSSLLYILLAVFGLAIVDYCLIQTELNKVAATPAK